MSDSLKRLIHLSISVNGAELRAATLNGINYIVCPVISKLGDNVEWPINASTPELIPSSVLSLSIADRNNRPVVMGHPQDALGNYISANDPEVLEKLAYGFTFSAKFEDNRVKSEMWLDPIRAEKVGPDAVNVITRLQSGQMVEVSEGDYVLSEKEEGEWNGKAYGARWIACWSDHLATLRDGRVGACSIEDGCGALRTSQGLKSSMIYIDLQVSALSQARKPTYTGTESTVWTKPTFADYIKYLFNGDEAPISISKCSSDLLRRMASHSLLGDPEAKNFQGLTFYPVVNPSTGYLNENALRGVVAGKGSNGLSDSALTSAQEMATRLLNSEFSANIKPKPQPELEASMDKKKESIFKRMFASMSEALRNSMSNNSLRWKLYKAIEKVEPGISYVTDEDVEAKTVTYLVVLRFGDYWESNESEYHWYQRTFTLDESENVTVNDDRVEVEPFEGWKPVGEAIPTPTLETTASSSNTECGCHKPKGDKSMSVNRQSVINRLSVSGGPFAGNKAALEAMNDVGLGNLDKAYPVKAEDANPNLPATPANPNPPVEPATETPAQPVTPTTPVNTPTPQETQQTVSLSREDYTKMLAASNAFEAQQQAKKTALVTSLSTAQTAFTLPDLQAMEMSVLEKMAQALKVDQPQSQASYVALPVNSGSSRPALRELPDPLGLKVHSLRPDGKQIERAN